MCIYIYFPPCLCKEETTIRGRKQETVAGKRGDEGSERTTEMQTVVSPRFFAGIVISGNDW